jgi:hypothetical protein
MELFETIYKRRSIRKFTEETIRQKKKQSPTGLNPKEYTEIPSNSKNRVP